MPIGIGKIIPQQEIKVNHRAGYRPVYRVKRPINRTREGVINWPLDKL